MVLQPCRRSGCSSHVCPDKSLHLGMALEQDQTYGLVISCDQVVAFVLQSCSMTLPCALQQCNPHQMALSAPLVAEQAAEPHCWHPSLHRMSIMVTDTICEPK